MYSFSVTTAVRGFHVYKDVWEPTISEVLSCESEIGNSHNTFAVAIKNSSEVRSRSHSQIFVINLFDFYSSLQLAIDDDGITFDNGPDGSGNSGPCLQVDILLIQNRTSKFHVPT